MKDKLIDKLLVKISRGSNAALEDLYILTRRGVFSFVYSYLNNVQDAEDVMQEVYLKIKKGISLYRRGTNARAWILEIAKNLALNHIRRRRVTVDIEDYKNYCAQSPPPGGDVTLAMHKVLSEEERYIVILHVLWGFKHREIAEMLNCPVGTITAKYNRSIDKLKRELKEAEQ